MQIKWTSKAVSDTTRLHDFISATNPEVASKFIQSLVNTPKLSSNNPRLGEQLFHFEPRQGRRLLMRHYEIPYEVLQHTTIYILRIWHTREER